MRIVGNVVLLVVFDDVLGSESVWLTAIMTEARMLFVMYNQGFSLSVPIETEEGICVKKTIFSLCFILYATFFAFSVFLACVMKIFTDRFVI